jgi:16S rRNA processing protein RimM
VTRLAHTDASAEDMRGSDGAPASDEPRFVVVGRILRPHGVRGEVVVEVVTDFPQRFDSLKVAYLGDARHAEAHQVRQKRWHKDLLLMAFEGYPDRDSVEALRDLLVQVPVEEAVPLPEGEYYPYQLAGMDVITEEGEALGTLSDVLFTNANDVYVVTGPRGQILLPAIRQVIKQIDLPGGRIIVQLMPGLVD